jgi:hypothetical protein
MSGLMMSSEGERGTKIYMLREGAPLPYLVNKENKPKYDPTGKKQR